MNRNRRSCTWHATRRSSSSRRQKFMYSSTQYCVWGKTHQYPRSSSEWKTRLTWFKSTQQYKELDGLDGEAVKFEIREIQKWMGKLNCKLEDIPERMKFMSMFNVIIWRNKENELTCVRNSAMVLEYAKRFELGCWSFLEPGSEKEVECCRHCWWSSNFQSYQCT